MARRAGSPSGASGDASPVAGAGGASTPPPPACPPPNAPCATRETSSASAARASPASAASLFLRPAPRATPYPTAATAPAPTTRGKSGWGAARGSATTLTISEGSTVTSPSVVLVAPNRSRYSRLTPRYGVRS